MPFTEEEAHRILARAVELDARAADEISIELLRQIAEEAGIGAASLDRALQEWHAGRGSPVQSRSYALSELMVRFRRHAIVAFTIAGAFLSPGDVFVTTLIGVLPAMALYEVVLRLARRRSGTGSPPQRLSHDSVVSADSPEREVDTSPRTNSRALRLRHLAPAT